MHVTVILSFVAKSLIRRASNCPFSQRFLPSWHLINAGFFGNFTYPKANKNRVEKFRRLFWHTTHSYHSKVHFIKFFHLVFHNTFVPILISSFQTVFKASLVQIHFNLVFTFYSSMRTKWCLQIGRASSSVSVLWGVVGVCSGPISSENALHQQRTNV